MCGIVGGVAERNVEKILIEGLKRLEYRGYDSAGMAVVGNENNFHRIRAKGKVKDLEKLLDKSIIQGKTGIAHTRWATHGVPSETNAHPLVSSDLFAVVHNGIIENHHELRQTLTKEGYHFTSETDTETVVHLLHFNYKQYGDVLKATQQTISQLQGAYALGIVCAELPGQLFAVRNGSPLVIGKGIGEAFVASDPLALLPVTRNFIYLEDNDIAVISKENIHIYADAKLVERKCHELSAETRDVELGEYQHFMMKEIAEQPAAVMSCIEDRLTRETVLPHAFGVTANEVFKKVQQVQIVACGTSYHAALVAKYWLEAIAGIPCAVEIASEFRYRNFVVQENTLFVCISQSGETADTLAALRLAKKLKYLSTLAICNVFESSIIRESDLNFLTRAGAEIGVASTKAFTTQLTALLLLSVSIGRYHQLTPEKEKHIVTQLILLPDLLEKTLTIEPAIKEYAKSLVDKNHALFIGRGILYPIAIEGALKLKEISYIHAEGYPAGELKHGPLALVDKNMPVIALVPNNDLIEKTKSNLQEVVARGGDLYVFTDNLDVIGNLNVRSVIMPVVDALIAPIIYTVPLQLLAYHVAVLKGTDVDQPRNLAKSVTVE